MASFPEILQVTDSYWIMTKAISSITRSDDQFFLMLDSGMEAVVETEASIRLLNRLLGIEVEVLPSRSINPDEYE